MREERPWADYAEGRPLTSPTRRGWRPPCWRPRLSGGRLASRVPPGVDRFDGALGLVQGALECLQELGWIRPEALRAPDGGRPSVRLYLNPRLAAGCSRTPEPAAPQVTDQIAKTRFCRFWRVPGGGVERLDATGRCASRRPARLPSPGS